MPTGAAEGLQIESRAATELAALHASPVFWGRGVPRGDGKPVVVIPGLFGNDWYLRPMRDWLRRIGYRPVRSSLAVNAGCSDRLLATIEEGLVRQLRDISGPLAVIGHSRGGMLAWALADRLGGRVTHLCMLGSPAPAAVAVFRELDRRPGGIAAANTVTGAGMAQSAVAAAGRRATRLLDPDCDVPACNCSYVRSMMTRPNSVTKVMSIASNQDPIVPTVASDLRHAGPGIGDNVTVSGSHSGLAHNRAVYEHLARFLAS